MHISVWIHVVNQLRPAMLSAGQCHGCDYNAKLSFVQCDTAMCCKSVNHTTVCTHYCKLRIDHWYYCYYCYDWKIKMTMHWVQAQSVRLSLAELMLFTMLQNLKYVVESTHLKVIKEIWRRKCEYCFLKSDTFTSLSRIIMSTVFVGEHLQCDSQNILDQALIKKLSGLPPLSAI